MQVPGLRQAKFLLFPLLSPVQCVLLRILATPFFCDTARQTAEKSNVFGVLGSNSSGTPLLAQCADSGAPLLRACSGPGSQFADDRLAASDELLSGERVHGLLRCAGSSGVPVLRACGTDGLFWKSHIGVLQLWVCSGRAW